MSTTHTHGYARTHARTHTHTYTHTHKHRLTYKQIKYAVPEYAQ